MKKKERRESYRTIVHDSPNNTAFEYNIIITSIRCTVTAKYQKRHFTWESVTGEQSVALFEKFWILFFFCHHFAPQIHLIWPRAFLMNRTGHIYFKIHILTPCTIHMEYQLLTVPWRFFKCILNLINNQSLSSHSLPLVLSLFRLFCDLDWTKELPIWNPPRM